MSVRIADLSDHDKPRERLLTRGVDALSDRELLALVLGSGRRGESALDLAAALLADHGGLAGLARARPEELGRRSGVGPAKAAAVVAALRLGRLTGRGDSRPVIRSAGDVARIAIDEIGSARQEILLVLVCNGANRVVATVRVGAGAAERVPMPVRDVVQAAVRHDGRAFAIAHNHPSGDATPSGADRDATRLLIGAATTLGLRFLDHVVVAGAAWERVTPGRRTSPRGSPRAALRPEA